MNNIDVQHVMAQLAEHLLMDRSKPIVQKGTDERNTRTLRTGCYGMYFRIVVDCENHGYASRAGGTKHHKEWERRFQRTVHVIITERHNVFCAVTDPRQEPEQWENSSNHDSCWRDSLSVVDDVLYEGYKHCFGFMPDADRPAPVMTSPYVAFESWHFYHPPFKIVKVKADYDGENHRYTLNHITPQVFQLIVGPKDGILEGGSF